MRQKQIVARYRLLFWLLFWLLLIVTTLLGGCNQTAVPDFQQDTHILFWYDWTGADEQLLQGLLDNFEQLNTHTRIIDAPITGQETIDSLVQRFEEGIEPDLMLVNSDIAQQLIQLGLVKELSQYGVKPGNFMATALSTVSDGDKIYGLPFALSTQLLFYNKATVPEPPLTIKELTELAAQPDVVMGLNTSFFTTYWGVRAFGGRTYDSDGHFVVDRGALTNWLSTLTSIQGTAGFYLSNYQEQLRKRFLAGEIDLYVADASEANELAASMGDQLGIALLPQGDTGNPAGPLLQVSVLMISANDEEAETAQALKLAQFLTNSQQQSLLTAGNTGHISAVNTVSISPSMPEVVVQLAAQIISAVPIRLAQRPVWDEVAKRGIALYRGVVEGAIDEQAAAGELADYVNELQGKKASSKQSSPCPPLEKSTALTLSVWHSWSEEETRVLESLADDFQTLCPSVTFSLTRVSSGANLNTLYRAAAEAGSGPDMLIASTQWMPQLAADGLIRSLDNEVSGDELAAFVTSAVGAVQFDDRLYAYPESVRAVALIYNPTLVTDPPKTLNELLLTVDTAHQFTMPLTFFYAYWGLKAFGSQLFDDQEVFQFNSGGAADWLNWLHSASRRPGFAFTVGRSEAEQLFLDRKAAFLVSGPWSLPRLRAHMPDEEIAVALLPAGPVSSAVPILEVEGFMVNSAAGTDALAAGVAFARFVTSVSSAQRLVSTGVHVPANVTVEVADKPIIDAFMDQAQLGEGIQQDQKWQIVLALGDNFYQRTVVENENIEAAVEAFTLAVNSAVNAADSEAANEADGEAKNAEQ